VVAQQLIYPVMVGLVPTIHVLASGSECGVQDVDARHKGEHDGGAQSALQRAF
jgi:hypothetical protein